MRLASLLGSTSALHRLVVNVRAVEYLQSAVLLWRGNRAMCTHGVDENTELLEVGSRSAGKEASNTFAICDILH